MWQWQANDSDHSDEETTKFDISPPSYIIISVDTHPSMFEKEDDGLMPFRMCFEAISKMADSIIFSTSERKLCPFAITVARKDNIVLRHFRSNLIDTIKFINQKLEQSDDDLRKEYMRDISEPLELSNFLLQSKKVFLDVSKSYYKRILLFITNDDFPDCARDASGMFTIINEAKSLNHADITFKVIATSPHFDFGRFYKEVFEASGQELVEEVCMDVLGVKQKLKSTVALTEGHKRIHFYIKMGEAEHMIKCYKFIAADKYRILNNALYTKDGHKVNKTKSYPTPVVYKYRVLDKYNSTQYVYDQHKFEQATVDSVIPYGYTFLYISPSLMRSGEQVKPSRVLICDSSETDEGKQLFRKLWDALVECNRVMVCHEKATRRNKINYAQLSPYLMEEEQVYLVQRIPFGTQMKWPMEALNVDDESSEDEPQSERIKSLAERLIETMSDEDFNLQSLVHGKIKAKKEFVKSKLFGTPFDTTGPIKYTRKQEADERLGEDLIEDMAAMFPYQPRKAQKRRRAPASSKVTSRP